MPEPFAHIIEFLWNGGIFLWDWLVSLDWESIFGSIVVSIFASAVFWALTFKISPTDVRFALNLERSPNVFGWPGYRYRVRFANLGSRDLIEVSIVVKMTIERPAYNQITYLNCGDQNFLPILNRWPRQFTNASYPIRTLEIYPSDVMCRELSKNFYPDHIRASATNRKISLDDLFDYYRDKVQIQVYLYGNDRTTGARRVFISPSYTIGSISYGKFQSPKHLQFPAFSSKNTRRRIFSQIDPLPPKQ